MQKIYLGALALLLSSCADPPKPAAAPSRQRTVLPEENRGIQSTPWGRLRVIADRPAVFAAKPGYPFAMARAGISGVVTLQALVDESGKVADARVLQSSGHGEFDEMALNTIKKWRYSALVEEGEAKKMVAIQNISFTSATKR